MRRAVVDLPAIFDPDDMGFDPTTQFKPIGDADESEMFEETGVDVTSTDDIDTPTGTHNRIESDGTHEYLFDDNGNRIRRTHIVNDTVTIYTWDVGNRLVMVTDYASTADADLEQDPTQVVEYTYDLFGRRIGKSVDTDGDSDVDLRERYIWSDFDANVALDFSDDDLDGDAEPAELSARYLWGSVVDQLFAQKNVDDLVRAIPEDVLWALTDNLGTVRDLARYDAFARSSNDTRRSFLKVPVAPRPTSRYGRPRASAPLLP